ncbi:MAG: ABC transporter permease [Candidatus Limnocylindrales bacterium]
MNARRALTAQTALELRLVARRGENLTVTLLIPLVLLGFLALVPLGSLGTPGLDALVPGILCLALISTGLVSLGIATAFERSNGTLKRLAGSPLPRWALLSAKALAVAATAVLQVALILGLALILGFAPPAGVAVGLVAAAPWLVLGTLASAAAGLLLAGLLRAEATLAIANAVDLLILLFGGLIVPLDRLPPALAGPAAVLPPALMADLVGGAFSSRPVDLGAALGLVAWTVVLALATLATFRVEEA